MSFTSVAYVVFLILVWQLYRLTKGVRARQVMLLVAGYAFYASWDPRFLTVLVASSLANFGFGFWLRRRPAALPLWTGVAFNVSVLALFKYLGWALSLLGITTLRAPGVFEVAGLSFYTFQAMSYLFDVYRGTGDTEPTFLEFLLYMAFWPTVLAGPVNRTREMVPQFRRLAVPPPEDLATGSARIALGLFLKVAVADTLKFGIVTGTGIDAGFARSAAGWNGIDVWCLAAGFGLQLFFDFAGYSHIAIGTAQLFGIVSRENFNAPYFSTSPTEFWTRWHMSLSSWIRDYVFFPLAAYSRAPWWRYGALIFSMTVFGLWHGPSVLFLLWGTYHGVLLVLHRIFQQLARGLGMTSTAVARWSPVQRDLVAGASWLITACTVSLGWVLFRAGDLAQARAMLAAALSPRTFVGARALSPMLYMLVPAVAGGYFAVLWLQPRLRRVIEGNLLVAAPGESRS